MMFAVSLQPLGSIRTTTVELNCSLSSRGEGRKSVLPGLLRKFICTLALISLSEVPLEGCVYLLFWREVRRAIVTVEEGWRQIGPVGLGEDFLTHHQGVQQ